MVRDGSAGHPGPFPDAPATPDRAATAHRFIMAMELAMCPTPTLRQTVPARGVARKGAVKHAPLRAWAGALRKPRGRRVAPLSGALAGMFGTGDD